MSTEHQAFGPLVLSYFVIFHSQKQGISKEAKKLHGD
jgi:hypothetical protein